MKVRERLEIELSDGRLLSQTGLAPFAASPAGHIGFETMRQALAARIRGVALDMPAPVPAEDRWGRIAGHVHAQGENLGLWLVSRGLARVAPLAADPCGRNLLSAEAKARQAKLGLWADPYYSVLAAVDAVALTSRSGEFVLIEGRILRLGQTSARFYLDFGPARGVDLSVTISKQFTKIFQTSGVTIEALQGQRVRARGMVEFRPGPSIDISSPFSLEVLGR